KWPILTIVIIIVVLMLMITIGFAIGILSEDPDGLERALIDARGEKWLENLQSPWVPILGWIESDYIAGIIGILLSVVLMVAIFYVIAYIKKKRA
ncbi:MAG: hypothetical protein ACFFDK_19520, partial [Promethearchaeota archaeon]